MRISFTYHGTVRHGVLLGVFSSADNRLILSVREDQASAVKSFSAEKMTNVKSVLESHEQVPGVLARPLAEGDIPQLLVNLSTSLTALEAKHRSMSEDLDTIFQRLQKLEQQGTAGHLNRIVELENKLDDVRIALTD